MTAGGGDFERAACLRLAFDFRQIGMRRCFALGNRVRWGLARQRYAALSARLPRGEDVPAELASLRWLLVEFGVQLFAQELGTAVPVSAKRVAASFALAEARLARL